MKVSRAKVAVFTTALDIAQTETKGTVLIKNADEMLNFTTGEEKQVENVRGFNQCKQSGEFHLHYIHRS